MEEAVQLCRSFLRKISHLGFRKGLVLNQTLKRHIKTHQDTLFGIFCLPCLQARREHENGETQASISESVAFGSWEMLSRTRSLNYCREIARFLTAPCLKSGHTRSKLVKRKPHRCGSVVFCLRFGLFWLRFQVSSFLVYGKRYTANSRKTNGAITSIKILKFSANTTTTTTTTT